MSPPETVEAEDNTPDADNPLKPHPPRRPGWLRQAMFALLTAGLVLGGLEALLRLLPEVVNPDRERTLANNQAPSEPIFFETRLSALKHLQPESPLGLSDIPLDAPLDAQSGSSRMLLPRLDMHPRPFTAQKPPGGLRMVVLGSSAAHGFGMSQNGAFAHRLEQLLEPLYPTRVIEVLNLGVVAWSSQQHLWLAKRVLKTLEPDLLILYAGNNELAEAATVRRYFSPERYRRWLTITRIERTLSGFRLFGLVKALVTAGGTTATPEALPLTELPRLDDTQAARLDAEARAFAADAYTHHIGRMATLAEEAQVPLVLMTPGANLRTPPYAFPPPPEVAEAFQQRMQAAEAKEVIDNPSALRLYQEAQALYDSPQVHFRQARVLEGLQRREEARAALKKARDRSEHPNRAPGEVLEAIRVLAEERRLPLVEGDRVFEQAAPDGIPGYDLVYDYCHPTVLGHWLLAEALAETLWRAGLLKGARGRPEPGTLRQVWLEDFKTRRTDWEDVQEWLGITLASRPEVYFGDSRPPMIELMKALRASLAEGVTVEKVIALGNAAYLTSWRSGDYFLAGDPLLAIRAWQTALTLDPKRCQVYGNLGIAYAQMGELRLARLAFEQALSCEPTRALWQRWLRRLEILVSQADAGGAQGGSPGPTHRE